MTKQEPVIDPGTRITLFTTAGCHLCELAHTLLIEMDISPQSVEIGDNDDLIARYATRIPVIKFSDDSELNWPFSSVDIAQKLSSSA